jgi:hypothetical protein
MVPSSGKQATFQFYWIHGLLSVVLCAGTAACSLGEPVAERSPPPARRSARAVVQAWQEAALAIPGSGTGTLAALASAPFELSAPEEARFRAETSAQTARSLDGAAARAAMHTGALIARATSAETTFESTRRGEIVATVGGDRGYQLTLRREGESWKVIRFSPAPRTANRETGR